MLAAAWVSLVLVSGVYASEPSGLYILVEEVELGPTADAPEWIKIRGVFNSEVDVERKDRFNDYRPVRGWAYFTLPTSKKDLARAEWRELANLAATTEKKVVAFGSTMAGPFDMPCSEFRSRCGASATSHTMPALRRGFAYRIRWRQRSC